MKHCGEKKFVLSREPDKDKRYRRDSHYRRLVPAGALGAAETVVTGLAGPLPRVVESREKPRPRERERADPVGWLEVTDPSPRAESGERMTNALYFMSHLTSSVIH